LLGEILPAAVDDAFMHTSLAEASRWPEMIATTELLTVVVADHHPLFLTSIERTIEAHSELELVGSACDGIAALGMIRRLRPDVAVVDVIMPELDGQGVMRAVTAEQLDTRLLILCEGIDADAARRLLSAGASGYLSKEADGSQILTAVIDIARGRIVVEPRIQSALLEGLRNAADAQIGPSRLSVRELQTLDLTSRGLGAKTVAVQLSVSPHTIHTNLRRIYGKLGVCTQAGAVGEAMRRGLLR
jgi:DNA-binding NarL/FixJ family response regulator